MKNKKTRKSLLLQGSSQEGKMYVFQDFARTQFAHLHYFALEELKTDRSSIFNNSPLKFPQRDGHTEKLEIKKEGLGGVQWKIREFEYNLYGKQY